MTACVMQTFQDTIKRFPVSSDVHNYYRELLADQGKLNDAVDMFNKAKSLDPNHHLPYINKTMVMYQIDPACDTAVVSLAHMLLEQDRPSEALTYYEKAMDLARNRAELEHAISYVEATKQQ